MIWLAAADAVQEIKSGWGSLIFTGCFFVVVAFAVIWWLKR